jgi:hypothetical protein
VPRFADVPSENLATMVQLAGAGRFQTRIVAVVPTGIGENGTSHMPAPPGGSLQGMGVGAGVGVAVGFGFGFWVGVAVGRTVGRGIGVAVGAAVDRAGVAVGARVAVGVGFSSTGVALGALDGVAVAVAAGVGIGLGSLTALTASVGVGELDWAGLPDVTGRTATMSMTRPINPTAPTVPRREMVTRGSLRSTP